MVIYFALQATLIDLPMIGFLCYANILAPFVKVLLLEKRWKEINSFLTMRVKINTPNYCRHKVESSSK